MGLLRRILLGSGRLPDHFRQPLESEGLVLLEEGLIEATVDKPGRLCLAYDAERFRDDRSGRVEVRLRTANARRVVELFRGVT